ncbi:hypothetical protein ACK31M_19800 [Aeromonas caviae]
MAWNEYRGKTMRKIEVSFTVSVPAHLTDEQIQEWLDFELHARGSMSLENPLSSESIEADSFSVEFK